MKGSTSFARASGASESADSSSISVVRFMAEDRNSTQVPGPAIRPRNETHLFQGRRMGVGVRRTDDLVHAAAAEVIDAIMEEVASDLGVAILGDRVVELDFERVAADPPEEESGWDEIAQHEDDHVGRFRIELESRKEAPDAALLEVEKIAEVLRLRTDLENPKDLVPPPQPDELDDVDRCGDQVEQRDRIRADQKSVDRKGGCAHQIDDAQPHDRPHQQRDRDKDGGGVAEAVDA